MSSRDRGYRNMLDLPAGSPAVVIEDIYGGRNGQRVVILPEGEGVTIMSYSNAGFNGIEAWVQDSEGNNFYSVPAGHLGAL